MRLLQPIDISLVSIDQNSDTLIQIIYQIFEYEQLFDRNKKHNSIQKLSKHK